MRNLLLAKGVIVVLGYYVVWLGNGVIVLGYLCHIVGKLRAFLFRDD